MSMTITLDDELAARLQSGAVAKATGVQEYAIRILIEALEKPEEITLEEFVTKVRATPPNPNAIRKATANPVDLLSGDISDLSPEPEASNLEMISMDELIARIRATPPNPNAIRKATGNLAESLSNSPIDPNFDVEAWNREWAAVEAKMKAITRDNDIAEGRGLRG